MHYSNCNACIVIMHTNALHNECKKYMAKNFHGRLSFCGNPCVPVNMRQGLSTYFFHAWAKKQTKETTKPIIT